MPSKNAAWAAELLQHIQYSLCTVYLYNPDVEVAHFAALPLRRQCPPGCSRGPGYVGSTPATMGTGPPLEHMHTHMCGIMFHCPCSLLFPLAFWPVSLLIPDLYLNPLSPIFIRSSTPRLPIYCKPRTKITLSRAERQSVHAGRNSWMSSSILTVYLSWVFLHLSHSNLFC